MLESLRARLDVFRKDVPAKNRDSLKSEKCPCNQNAGAEILSKYQHQWMVLHQISEENAEKAGEIDKIIASLQAYCQRQHDTIAQFNSQMTLLPKLNQSVRSLIEEIGKLDSTFRTVDNALVNLEDIIEIQELQEKQLDHRFRLALAKENKLADLEQLKIQLANAHAEKVLAFEAKHQKVLKERQETFKEAFEEEMQHYKIHGRIERLPSKERQVSLEEIQLEDDPSSLNEFLAEEATEDTCKQSDALAHALAEAIDDEDKPEIIQPNEQDEDQLNEQETS